MLLNPVPHSQYGSGSRTAKSVGIHVDPTSKFWTQIGLSDKTKSCSESVSRFRIQAVPNPYLNPSCANSDLVRIWIQTQVFMTLKFEKTTIRL
jgi:hypothetical protein